uniref:Uncharacterized protein n=1 Tax=Candidatus Kentrum sp. DK TaxID=2126562 RepID=A0A450STX9_9GAMM|nr:MAG: hypothetical protein BECKDK2373C_GA0170839_10407 [Candidatus Kentron sp. DK]VFJ57421.1 MAG: hypothetical protein BECKDK2373B_GA0170837_106613 [Candidatus Kentron sp. DK]
MRMIAEPRNHHVTIELPQALCRGAVEITVLPVSDSQVRNQKRRTPPPELASTWIADDLIAPTTVPDEWNVLQ